MKYFFSLLLAAGGFVLNCFAQQFPNAHSHNDYNQAVPFFHAFQNGFGSIEADVYVRNDRLLVAHDEKELRADRSLKSMYLDPLKKALKKDTSRRVTLLIDIKEGYASALDELLYELKPLRKFCRGYAANGRLWILISGNRPLPALFKNYPDYIYFDEDLKHPYTADELARIGQISLRYTNYAKWDGTGNIPAAGEARLKAVINKVHQLGKPIRFWGDADNRYIWAELLALHADMIGTDHLDALRAFLSERDK